MQYLLLIHADPSRWEDAPENERKAVMAEYVALAAEMRERDAYVDGNELQDPTAATTVRVVDGETAVTDGPFVETKEALGGYFLIEVESLDEAIEWAARIPAARHGAVEVRPLVPSPVEASA